MNLTPDQLYAAGRLQEAAAACRQRLASDPTSHTALHLLGVILCREKKFDEGLPMLERSTVLAPSFPDYRVNYGLALNEAQRWSASEPVLRTVLSDVPDHLLALLNLGNSLHGQGRSIEAIPLYRRALELRPGYNDARINLAVALKSLGQIQEAKALLQSVFGSEPENSQAMYEQARMLADQKRYDQAEHLFRKVLQLDPAHHQALYCLGIVLSDQGRWAEACEAYAQVVRSRPDLAEGYQAMAVMLRYCNRISESIIALEKAIALRPEFTLALQSYGSVLTEAGRIEEGIEVWRRSLSINPNQPDVRSNVAYTLSMVDGVTRADLWHEHRTWAEHHAAHPIADAPQNGLQQSPGDRIRIGYISPDFRLHSVCYFFMPLIQNHDRKRFEIFCYSDVGNPDTTTAEIMRLSDHWRNIHGKKNPDVFQQVREDRIDVLIDLAGHTMANRMELFGLKPAPIQASWLGYPETTGLPTVDYKIADEIVFPSQEDGLYSSEAILRLPSGYHCYMAPPGCPEIELPPSQRNGYITFGSFSSLAKLTPSTVGLWSEVLKRVPGSKLLLKARQLADLTVRDRYVSMFAACGIPRDRLRLEVAIAETTKHLEFYKEIDIALDTHPYNGTTTLCEGLWMGVVPVTLQGSTPASRVGASLLVQLGLHDWIAKTPTEFVEIANRFSRDLELLSKLRSGMRDQITRTSLGSPSRFAKEFENGIMTIMKAI
jgi:protein O-GlcNAc transferase